MRFSWVGIVLAVAIFLFVSPEARAGQVFATGISIETTADPTNITFGNFSGGGITSVNNQGRRIVNIDLLGGHWADITFTFNNVSIGTSDFIKVWIDRSQTGSGTNTMDVISVDGAAATMNPVSITNTDTDTRYILSFTLASADQSVSAITIRFNMATGPGSLDIDAVATPEPGTLALLGVGMLGAGAWARRRRKRKKTA
ncbi:MAG: PEP-CTERM sorting domain-containing protein [Planctomycetota bacterium]|jgi:hypothetical protein